MTIRLLHSTPLHVCSTAIRKCWNSEAKSDNGGNKDRELIHRVGNKNKHSSTLEHLNYTFDIRNVSRALLQEVARHRHASISVKSTRYTLKELKKMSANLDAFLVKTGDHSIDTNSYQALRLVQQELQKGKPNDIVKYMLPENFKTSYVWTINARSLQNFLSLRTDKSALWEIRRLAYKVYETLPDDHKYLFKEFVKEID